MERNVYVIYSDERGTKMRCFGTYNAYIKWIFYIHKLWIKINKTHDKKENPYYRFAVNQITVNNRILRSKCIRKAL